MDERSSSAQRFGGATHRHGDLKVAATKVMRVCKLSHYRSVGRCDGCPGGSGRA